MIPMLVLLAVLACAGPAAAQTAGEQPSPRLQGNEPAGLGDWLRWPRFAGAGEDSPDQGAYALLGSIVSGAGLSVGGGYRDYSLFGSPLGFDLSAMGSIRGYQAYRVQFGALQARRHTLDMRPADAPLWSMVDEGRRARRGIAAYLDARYRFHPRGRFYGIGPNTREEDRTDYLLKGGGLDLVVQGQVTPAVGLCARAGVLDSAVEEGRDDEWPAIGTRYTPAQAPGLADPPRYLVLGAGAAFDTRQAAPETQAEPPLVPRLPDERRVAVFLSAAAWRFNATRGEDLDFTRLAFDGRAFFAPRALPGTVAVRIVTSADLPPENGRVPFFLQHTLGGGELLRAYGTSRWQDHAVAHATVEYRFLVHRFVEVAPFVDAGTVGPRLRALALERVKTDVGVGLRARWRETVLGRMDWAWGSEGVRVNFGVGGVF